MKKVTSLALSIGLMLAATSAIAQQSTMKVNVLIVESFENFRAWMQQAMEAAAGKAQNPGQFPPSLKEVPADKKVFFPIVVGGLRPPAQGTMKLVADVEVFGPDGKSLNVMKHCCGATIVNKPDWRTVLLDNTTIFELESTDKPGNYTVRVSVTDGAQTLKTSETFHFSGSKSPPARATASTTAPKLRMDAPARNPGSDTDKRDCLALPTSAEVIKCAERK